LSANPTKRRIAVDIDDKRFRVAAATERQAVFTADRREAKPKLDDDGEPVLKARYSMHCFRHAAASAWIRQRIDLKRLQVWMGHSSIQITIDTYGHLIADEVGDAALAAAAHADLLA